MMKKLIYTLFFMVLSSTLLFSAEAASAAAEAATGKADGLAKLLAHVGVALTVGIPALGTGWAQSRIGAAGAGAIAERPELTIWVIVMLAIPETTVILGFVIAFMLMGKI
jgi:V/A-type H+-transporting ATPase subunit K